MIQATEVPEEYRDIEGPVPVTAQSQLRLRKLVHQFARYFRREFHYDFVQYEATERSDYRAYLFVTQRHVSPRVWAGACCFRFREYADISPRWALQWAWLHPYLRNRVLSVRIPGQGGRDSEIDSVSIPKLIRSRFRDEAGHGFRF